MDVFSRAQKGHITLGIVKFNVFDWLRLVLNYGWKSVAIATGQGLGYNHHDSRDMAIKYLLHVKIVGLIVQH